jgi:hypothetical protein
MRRGTLIGAGVIAVVVLAVAAYFGAGMLAKSPAANAGAVAGTTGGSAAGTTGDPNQPDRTAEVKGTVVSVDGTTITIDRLLVDASADLTDAQKAAKQAARQQMTMEERQAAKAAEQQGVGTERVTAEVPVGVPITRMASENGAPVAKTATLADIKSGSSITIWTDGKTNGGVAEYVKIQVGG